MERTRLCRAAEVPANGMKCFDTSIGVKVLLVRAGDDLVAFQGLCPHQDVCLDEGMFDGAVITCHQHLWQWDAKTGDAIGLAEAPLKRYTLEQADGEVYVAVRAGAS